MKWRILSSIGILGIMFSSFMYISHIERVVYDKQMESISSLNRELANRNLSLMYEHREVLSYEQFSEEADGNGNGDIAEEHYFFDNVSTDELLSELKLQLELSKKELENLEDKPTYNFNIDFNQDALMIIIDLPTLKMTIGITSLTVLFSIWIPILLTSILRKEKEWLVKKMSH